jgi:hypothetical protein
MAQGLEVALMTTVRLCHFCEMGQRGSQVTNFSSRKRRRSDAEIIWDDAGDVCVEDNSYLRGRTVTKKNASVRHFLDVNT